MTTKKVSKKKAKKEEEKINLPQKKNQLPYLPEETNPKKISIKSIPKG